MQETRVEVHQDGSRTVRRYDDDGRLVERRNVPARRYKAWLRDGGVWRTSQNWAKKREREHAQSKREGVS
jgi:hypothetical protein